MRTTHYVWVLILLLAGVTALLVHLIEPDSGVRHDRATSSAGRVDPNERFAGAERGRGATRAGEEKQVEVQLEPRAELSGVARTECDGIPSPPLKIIATTRRLPEHGSQGPVPIPDLPAEILWGFFDHTRVPDGSFSIARLPRGTYRLVTDSNYWAIDPPVYVEAGESSVVVRVIPTFGLHARARDQETGEDLERFSLRVRAEGEKPGDVFERVVEGTAGVCRVRWRLPEWAPRGMAPGRPVLFRHSPWRRDVLFEVSAPGYLTWRTYARHSVPNLRGENPSVVFPRENHIVAWLLRDRPDNLVLSVTTADGRPFDGKLMGTYSRLKPKFDEPLALVSEQPGLFRTRLPRGRLLLAIDRVPTLFTHFQLVDVTIDEAVETHASLRLRPSAVVTIRLPQGRDALALSAQSRQSAHFMNLRETTRFHVDPGLWRFRFFGDSVGHRQNIDVVAGGEYAVEIPDR